MLMISKFIGTKEITIGSPPRISVSKNTDISQSTSSLNMFLKAALSLLNKFILNLDGEAVTQHGQKALF